jgi:para-nitrobenzyl esterase
VTPGPRITGASTGGPGLPVVIETGYGRVAGERRPSGVVYRSIPYAGPVTGPGRFAAPSPPRPWTGLRRTRSVAATSPAAHRPTIGALDITPLIGPGWICGDEYLTLTVWTPVPPGAKAPVLVFVHGGGFISGSHAADVLRGDAFLDSGVVLVTVNYRLGIAGWLDVPGAPSNRGLLDVIAALRWVRAEIHSFGGDPERVTVAGQSAGAMIVAALLASPPARGLFNRAVSASGNAENAVPPELAGRVTEAVARHLDVAADAAALSEISDERLVEAARNVPGTDFGFPRRPPAHPAAFSLVLDPHTLPHHPVDAVAAGRGHPVDLLVGSTTDEANIYLVPTGVLTRATEADVAALAARLGVAPADLTAVHSRDPGDGPAEILARATTDALFGAATRRLADAHAAASRGRTFSYQFTWRSNAFDDALGACHCVDLPWIFGTTDLSGLNGPHALLGTNRLDPKLVRRVHQAWVGFIHDGDPGWPEHRTMAPRCAFLP